jgi:hypothetical protein
MTIKKQLLLGCGHARRVQVYRKTEFRETAPEFEDLFTLDINADVQPDLVCNLDTCGDTLWNCKWMNTKGMECTDVMGYLRENFFDEIHAYEVLEHLGRQGYHEDFFNTFSNLYRALVPNGLVLATCPSRFGGWLWGDPGHRRAVTPETLTYLDQEQYHIQAGKTAMSDYRYIWKSDFKIIESYDDRKNTHSFVLQAIKPARSF